MKKSEDSRRRPVLIIAFTICIGLCLGYIYSYSLRNRELMNKHATLTFSYKTCSSLFEKCDGKLNKCVSTTDELQESKSHLLTSVETHKNDLASITNNLKVANDKISIAYQFYSDIREIAGLSDVEGRKTEGTLQPEMVNAIKEEIIKLKKTKADHEDLKVKYGILEDNHKKLVKINDDISLRVNKLEDIKNIRDKQLADLQRQNPMAEISEAKLDRKLENFHGNNFLAKIGDAKETKIKNVSGINSSPVNEGKTETEINPNPTMKEGEVKNVAKQEQRDGDKPGKMIAAGIKDQHTNANVNNDQDKVKAVNTDIKTTSGKQQ